MTDFTYDSPEIANATWASIENKIKGAYKASQFFGETCQFCNTPLSPFDIGVDPATEIRTWLVRCCGVTRVFEEIATY